MSEAILDGHEQFGRRQQWPLRVDATLFVASTYVFPEVLRGLLDTRQRKHLGVLRQVIEQCRGLVEEQRQVVLDSGRGDAGGQILVDRATAEIHIEAFTEARAEASDRLLLQREFASWQQADRLDLVDGSLVFRIEGAQRFDFVVEQVDAVGQGAAHRKQVDQRAAHCKLAMLVHRIDAAIAGRFEAGTHLLDIEFLADIQYKTGTEQKTLRGEFV